MKSINKFFKSAILIIFLSIGILGCSLDRELPEKSFAYEVQLSFPPIKYGKNDNVEITYEIKPLYDWNKLTMEVNMLSDVNSNFYEGEKKIETHKPHSISDKKGKIIYNGNVKGRHILTFSFNNSKGYKVEKKVEIDFTESSFGYKVEGKEGKIYVGEKVDYRLSILPSEDINDEYFIRFISYDPYDKGLLKSKIYLDNETKNFNEWYKIKEINNTIISLLASSDGDKTLKFEIKNKSSRTEGEIIQKIDTESFTLNVKGLEEKLNLYQTYSLQILTEAPFHNENTKYYAKIELSDIDAAHFYIWDNEKKVSVKYTSGQEIPIQYGKQQISVNIRKSTNFELKIKVYTTSASQEVTLNANIQVPIKIFNVVHKGEFFECYNHWLYDNKYQEKLLIKFDFEVDKSEEKELDKYEVIIDWREGIYEYGGTNGEYVRQENKVTTVLLPVMVEQMKQNNGFFVVWDAGCSAFQTKPRAKNRGWQMKIRNKKTGKVEFQTKWNSNWD